MATKKKPKPKSGGRSGKGTGRPGGGTFSQFSNTNEASARSALTKGYRGGEKVAKGYLTGGKGKIGGIKDTVKDYGKAMDTISGGYGTGRTDITTGTGQQVGAVNTGLDKSVAAVTGGANQALAEFDPYARAGTAASDLYMGALGTDPTGHAAAVDAFQVSPGYEFEMEQGLNQLERRAAARGQLGSGNTSLDSLEFSQGLANQDWGDWLDRLAAEQAMGVTVAGQRSGIETGLGRDLSGLYTGAGTALSGIYGTEGTQLANLATGEADKLSGLTTDLAGEKSDYAKTMADLAYRTKMGLGQTQAGYLLGKDKTGGNILGAIAGAANTGANLYNPPKPQGQVTA